jgi:HupE / UreJ protein
MRLLPTLLLLTRALPGVGPFAASRTVLARSVPALAAVVLSVVVPCVVALPAHAHDADILFVEARQGPGGRVDERVTLTAATLALLAPVDADGDGVPSQKELEARADALALGVWEEMPLKAGGVRCARQGAAAHLREGYVELTARFLCGPGERTQTFRLLSVLPPAYRVVLGRVGEGEQGHGFAQGALQTLSLGPASGQGRGTQERGLAGWVGLGVTHILEGWDHLAFLLAVLVVGGSLRRVLLLVSSFTLAHSLTLAAVALGWVALDGARVRWVEAAIAGSIIVVALENLLLREHRHRALLTFLFGLVHGFGFANALSGAGLGASVVQGLLGFNLGVELGQAAAVLFLFPLVRLLARRPLLARWTVRAISAGLVLVGSGWLAERVAG